jgi:hypothetical protein
MVANTDQLFRKVSKKYSAPAKRAARLRAMGSKVANRSKTLRFPDKNLQLALLDEVQTSPLWLAAHEADYEDSRGSHPTWPTWAAIRQGEKNHTHNATLEEYLLSLGVEADALASLKELVIDADRDLYGWVYSFWWESGDHFVIRDLSGLEQCSGLESLRLDKDMVDGCSLQPLGKLRNLKQLAINARGNFSDIDALLKIPNLQKLEIANAATSAERDEWDRVVDALCKKGLPSLSRI